MKSMRVYIAGPMRGVPRYNLDAFDRAAQMLRDQGHTPISPADMDRDDGFDVWALPDDFDWHEFPDGLDIREIFDRDMHALKCCDAIYMLPGWRQSVGATAEYHAAMMLGLYIMDNTLTDAQNRKQCPVASGVLDYFPDAIRAIAKCSWVGNEQHNSGEPLHWAREKSSDHADCLIRHFMERGSIDSDDVRHSTKTAWRALALLQLEIEESDETI